MRIVRVYALLWAGLEAVGAGEVAGSVRDLSGVHLAGAEVKVMTLADGLVRGSAVADAEGKFRFDLPPGIYTVLASNRWFTAEWKEPVELGTSGKAEVSFRLKVTPLGTGPFAESDLPARVMGTLTGRDGPVRNARICFLRMGHQDCWMSDSKGFYSFEIRPNAYVVRVIVDGRVISEQPFSAPVPATYPDRIVIK